LEECRLWCYRWYCMPLGTGGDSMSKYVIVDTVSQFRMRYVVEVPDDVGEDLTFKNGTRSFPTTAEDWAKDTVTCEEAKEFSQYWMGETIIDAREVKLGDVLAQFRKDEPVLGKAWNDQQILEKVVTQLKDQPDANIE